MCSVSQKDLQTSKRSDPECWFPEDGYVVCSVADARKVWSTQVAAIQPRDMDLNELHKTVDKYVELTLMDDIQQACWIENSGAWKLRCKNAVVTVLIYVTRYVIDSAFSFHVHFFCLTISILCSTALYQYV